MFYPAVTCARGFWIVAALFLHLKFAQSTNTKFSKVLVLPLLLEAPSLIFSLSLSLDRRVTSELGGREHGEIKTRSTADKLRKWVAIFTQIAS